MQAIAAISEIMPRRVVVGLSADPDCLDAVPPSLAPLAEKAKTSPDLARVLSIVVEISGAHRVAPRLIFDKCHLPRAVVARREAYYRSRVETGLTWHELADVFNRDHSVVLRGYARQRAIVEASRASRRISNVWRTYTPHLRALVERGSAPVEWSGAGRDDSLPVKVAKHLSHAGMIFRAGNRWLPTEAGLTSIGRAG